MKVLITQRAMENFGGSELYTAEVARALTARGHQVAVYCPKPGKIARLVTPSGVAVKDRIDDLPFVPDIIHGHHHLPLMAALAGFPDTPAVHVWHGARPWAERVPRHPRIRRYVVTSDRLGPQLTADLGIPAERVTLVRNFVDTGRFSHVREVAQRPSRAVLYGHGGFAPEELSRLDDACATAGLALDKIGYPYNNPRPRPEYFLPDYDIAFAIGRSALEAMACGCAVIPIVPQLAGHRITAATLDQWIASNCSPRYFTNADRFDRAWLREELSAWDPADIAAVTASIRASHTLTSALDALEATYRQALSEDPWMAEETGFAPYLEWLAPEVDEMWGKSHHDGNELALLRHENRKLHAELDASARRLRFLMETLLQQRGVAPLPEDADDDTLRRAIATSGHFDAEWYLATYPEVAEAGMDPVQHYLDHGAFEGRNPSPCFDGAAYMAANPHLRGMGMSPLEHFLRQLGALAPQPPAHESAPVVTPLAARGQG